MKREILSSDGALMLVKVDLEEGFVGDVDQHPEEQVSYIKKGQVEFELNGEKRVLTEGESLHIPANIIHRVKVIEKCTILDIFTPIRKDFL
ncbi:cupin domain-containing protein [Tepidibacillus marianensis]|uniref:cupin domain-containing protein n=1 Tax=Tepidibacillus marianensis TaxID=3131995 RepID=UPI0030D3C589